MLVQFVQTTLPFAKLLSSVFTKLVPFKRVQKCNDDKPYRDCWEELPSDVMLTIVQSLNLSDRIRMRIVCKSWRSIPMSNSIPTNELPWLVLPQSPNFKKDKTLSFISLSDSKVVDLELPKSIQGGWFCGSSKGWLIMFRESGLNSQMFLVNPISQALHQLPYSANIPSFHKYVEKEKDWKLYGASFFFTEILISESNTSSDRCVVAASCAGGDLWLCRPRDHSWSVFSLFKDAQEDDLSIGQLLFSRDKLYVLVDGDGEIRRERIENQTLSLGEYTLQLVMVYIDVDRIRVPFGDNIYDYNDHKICLRFNVWPFLVESINKEVLLIYKEFDKFIALGNNANEDVGEEEAGVVGHDMEEDEDEDDNFEELEEDIHDDTSYIEHLDKLNGWNENMYARTNNFQVYKIHAESGGNNVYNRVQSLGDQNVFLADNGSVCLSTTNFEESEKNCIYFANKGTWKYVLSKPNWSREIGVFHLNTSKIERPFPSISFTTRSRTSWYIASL